MFQEYYVSLSGAKQYLFLAAFGYVKDHIPTHSEFVPTSNLLAYISKKFFFFFFFFFLFCFL